MHAPLRRRTALLVVALVLAAGACSSGSSASSSGASEGSSATPTGTGSVTEPATAGAAPSFDDLAFDESDLKEGEQFVVPADGTTISDASPSLAFCQVDFPSEADRTARHRVQVLDAEYSPIATTEAVRYGTEAAAAMTELRGAFIDCPEDEPVDIGEGELVTYDAVPIDEAELGDLADDHVGADITTTDAEAGVVTSTIVAQRRGEVVVVVEGADHDRVVELATQATARLAAAESGSVGD